MAGKEIAVKKYVVRLSAEERAQLDELISKELHNSPPLKPMCTLNRSLRGSTLNLPDSSAHSRGSTFG